MAFCNSCGAQLDGDSRFCAKCGSDQTAKAGGAQAPAAVPMTPAGHMPFVAPGQVPMSVAMPPPAPARKSGMMWVAALVVAAGGYYYYTHYMRPQPQPTPTAQTQPGNPGQQPGNPGQQQPGNPGQQPGRHDIRGSNREGIRGNSQQGIRSSSREDIQDSNRGSSQEGIPGNSREDRVAGIKPLCRRSNLPGRGNLRMGKSRSRRRSGGTARM